MSFSKKDQQHLEVALTHRPTKEKLLDEMQSMRDAFNALLAKMDTDFTAQNSAVTSSQLDTDYESVLEIEDIRGDVGKTRL